MTQQEATTGQITKLGVRVLEAIPTIGLTKDQAQLHIERDVLTKVVEIVLQGHPDAVNLVKLQEMVGSYLPFREEELDDSEFGYPEGFPKKTWRERLYIIQQNFGGLNTSGIEGFIEKLVQRGLDEWVDDLTDPFVIPDWQAIGETYVEATVKAWDRLAESLVYKGRFYNYRQRLTQDRIKLVYTNLYHQLSREWGYQLKGIPTAAAHDRLRELRPTPVTVWPVFAQTGLRHRGRSVRRAHVCFSDTEWGLGPFEVACILLTDGEDRLTAYEHLGIDLPGAFYIPEADHAFDRAFCFRFNGDLFEYDGHWLDYPRQKFGSASASLR
jgi:hypothetical protein